MSGYHNKTGLFAPAPAKVATAKPRSLAPAAPAEALLMLEGVHTHIGAYRPAWGGLVVPRGQLTMLPGRNGAGKTTTLRTIMACGRPRRAGWCSRGRHHPPAHRTLRG